VTDGVSPIIPLLTRRSARRKAAERCWTLWRDILTEMVVLESVTAAERPSDSKNTAECGQNRRAARRRFREPFA
jgi:hypothetical protein